jgi:hypothetical protein
MVLLIWYFFYSRGIDSFYAHRDNVLESDLRVFNFRQSDFLLIFSWRF